jgi:peroxiredoxin
MRLRLGLQRQAVRSSLLMIGTGIGFFLLLPIAAGKSADYADFDHAFTIPVVRTQDSEPRSQNSELFNPACLNSSLRIVLPSTTEAQADEAYNIELQKGNELLRRRNYEEALKSFKRANEMRGKKSPECFFGMAQAYFGLDAFKNLTESCEKAIEFAVNDEKLRARAYNLKGLAVQTQAEGKDQKKLLEAETLFRQALELKVEMPILRHNLGVVLLQENRDPEGIAELEKYVKLAPNGDFAEEARKMIANPRRAREAYAPEFSVVTAAGEHITLEDLRGKVVVLDFWGTWCPPCVASVPALRNLNKRYTKEPSFVLIGISSDSEEEKWREFTTQNKMVWPQYRDRDQRIQRAFKVDRFPTYIVIDHEGIVRYRSVGMGWEHSVDLDNAVKKHVKIVGKSEAANLP